MTAFDDALAVILKREGGYSNDPRDNGGATNLGVTQGTWSAWIGRPASIADIKALTPTKVAPLYKKRYWDAVQGDYLPPALALLLFDFGVNAGPGRAARKLQRVVGVADDGQIGPATLKAVQQFATAHGEAELIRQFTNAKRDYYRSLDDFDRFGKGWLNRCDQIETECLKRCA